MYVRRFVWIALLLPLLTLAQKKQITLEDIYQKGTFRDERVSGFADEDLSTLFNAGDVKDETGKQLVTTDFEVSADKKRILFFTGRESIYRRSSIATAYI